MASGGDDEPPAVKVDVERKVAVVVGAVNVTGDGEGAARV